MTKRQPRASLHPSAIAIDDIEVADVDWVLTLNNSALPHVNLLNGQALADLLDQAVYARSIKHQGKPAGVLIAFAEGAAYDSLNYRWFADRFERFFYIDRIIVDAAIRGGGIGRALYADLVAFAAHKTPRLACEVNLRPPNPGSLRFHEELGFVNVGEQITDNGKKRVGLMLKSLPVGNDEEP